MTLDRTALARTWWGLLALIVGVAVLIDLVRVVHGADSATPVIRYLSYFTIQSNVLVTVVALTLCLDPARDGRAWRVLRLDALLGITVTGLVYVVVLASIDDRNGLFWWTNLAMHYVSPVAMVVGWLVLGPRPRITGGTVAWAMVYPVAWISWTMVHGAESRWYPYFFLDARDLGLAVALRNTALVVLVALVFLLVYWAADRWLPVTTSRRREHHDAATQS